MYDRLSQTDSAVTIYLRFIGNPGLGRINEDPFRLANTYRRLGELYEAQGRRQDALNYYGKLVELWKAADPELQPLVRDVKVRMARLAGEH